MNYARFTAEVITVATVPTACGIETQVILFSLMGYLAVATVPTACGIETLQQILIYH